MRKKRQIASFIFVYAFCFVQKVFYFGKKKQEEKKMKKRVLAGVLAAGLLAVCLGGCGAAGRQSAEESTESRETEASEEEKVKDTAILVVSFGTSYNDSREATIGAIEKDIADAFPKYEVRRAFTSQIISDKLKERDGLEIDNVEQALDRAVADGIKNLVVQPTHLMNGYEYTDLANALKDYEAKFDSIALGEPLLSSDGDFDLVILAITNKLKSYDDGKTAIAFMGHGTEADSNGVYSRLQDMLTEQGYENFYIGTVEATPSLDDLIAAFKEKGSYEKVVLEPLMVVAGDHANNDMAGDEDDSWKSILTKEGYEVECILEGLGQVPEIRSIYVNHVANALKTVTGE